MPNADRINRYERAARIAGFTSTREKDHHEGEWLRIEIPDGAICVFQSGLLLTARHHTIVAPEVEVLMLNAAGVIAAAQAISALAENVEGL